MFKVGDYIIYGTEGVCQVEEIGKPMMGGMSQERLYYTLTPVYSRGSRVFTPVDNKKVIIRPVISKEEAMSLIDEIPEIECLWVEDERNREEVYKEAIRTCDCRNYIKIIKSLYQRKQSRLQEGKKVTAGDEKYFLMAEDYLYGELAISLGMEKEQVKEFITSRVDDNQVEVLDESQN